MSFDDFSLNYMQRTGVVLPPHHDEIMAWVEKHLSMRLEDNWVDCDLPQEYDDQSFATPLGSHYAPSSGPPYCGVTQIQEPTTSASFNYPPPQQATTYNATYLYLPPTYGNFDGSSVTPPMAVADGHHPEFVAGSSRLPYATATPSSTSPPDCLPTIQGAEYGFTAPDFHPHFPLTESYRIPHVYDQWVTPLSAQASPYYDDGIIRYRRGANPIESDVEYSHSSASSATGFTAGSKRKSANTDLEQGGRELKMRKMEMARVDDESRPSSPGIQGGSMVRHREESIPRSAPYPNALQMLGEGPSVQPGTKPCSVRAPDLAAESEEREGEEDGSDEGRKESEEGEDVSEEGEGESEGEEEENKEGEKESKVKRWVCPYPSCRRKDGSRVDFGTQPDLVRHLKYALAHQPERTFPCLHCPKAYTRSDPLLKHMKSKHPDELN
ncbi:hypothetical protein EW146_g7191 [Bondarzewia mesenterica]|uniref:C2H2-type domain-containing protein n=1 Tax=Bondarzewia mesenterica TaxID=1095465 RepID=A0A4S4LM70_9AGAM|nr:hypothetical protein EW146_g7191 [Bondarzewia mesenterica]